MNNIHTSQGQSITISNNGIASVVATSSGMLVGRVANMDEDDDDDDMGDEGDDSFGEDDEMMGVSDVTSQLAAAGWRHGVKFCFVCTLDIFYYQAGLSENFFLFI